MEGKLTECILEGTMGGWVVRGWWKLNVQMNVGYVDGKMLSGYWVNRLKDKCWIGIEVGKDTWKVDGPVVVV